MRRLVTVVLLTGLCGWPQLAEGIGFGRLLTPRRQRAVERGAQAESPRPWARRHPLLSRLAIGLTACTLLTSCATAPPHNLANACSILREKPSWYEAARDSRKKWGVPISLTLALMKQESAFVHDAQPEFRWWFIIPRGRESSAYGYSQALDGTWADYKKATGRRLARRSSFDDAADFIGWYVNQTQRRLGIPFTAARQQAEAYYVGHAGHRRGAHLDDPKARAFASRVAGTYSMYRNQLRTCEAALAKDADSWWPF